MSARFEVGGIVWMEQQFPVQCSLDEWNIESFALIFRLQLLVCTQALKSKKGLVLHLTNITLVFILVPVFVLF